MAWHFKSLTFAIIIKIVYIVLIINLRLTTLDNKFDAGLSYKNTVTEFFNAKLKIIKYKL